MWNFALPERNHVETALGLSPETIFRYHQLKTDEDKRVVTDPHDVYYKSHTYMTYDFRMLPWFLTEADFQICSIEEKNYFVLRHQHSCTHIFASNRYSRGVL